MKIETKIINFSNHPIVKKAWKDKGYIPPITQHPFFNQPDNNNIIRTHIIQNVPTNKPIKINPIPPLSNFFNTLKNKQFVEIAINKIEEEKKKEEKKPEYKAMNGKFIGKTPKEIADIIDKERQELERTQLNHEKMNEKKMLLEMDKMLLDIDKISDKLTKILKDLDDGNNNKD